MGGFIGLGAFILAIIALGLVNRKTQNQLFKVLLSVAIGFVSIGAALLLFAIITTLSKPAGIVKGGAPVTDSLEPNLTSSALTPSPSPTSTPMPTSPPTPTATVTPTPTTYFIDLANGIPVPIGLVQPTSADITSADTIKDLYYSAVSGESAIVAESQNAIAPLASRPTYEGCKSDTDIKDNKQVSATQGSSFCMYEDNGATVGGFVISVDDSTGFGTRAINPSSIRVQFTVWPR